MSSNDYFILLPRSIPWETAPENCKSTASNCTFSQCHNVFISVKLLNITKKISQPDEILFYRSLSSISCLRMNGVERISLQGLEMGRLLCPTVHLNSTSLNKFADNEV